MLYLERGFPVMTLNEVDDMDDKEFVIAGALVGFIVALFCWVTWIITDDSLRREFCEEKGGVYISQQCVKVEIIK